MSSQDDYYGLSDPLAEFDLDNLDYMTTNNEGEFEGVDFTSFPPLDLPEFDVNQSSDGIPAHVDVAGDISDVLESNIDPMLRGSSAQLTADPPILEFSQFDMNLLSNENSTTLLDVAGGIPNVVELDANSLLFGSNTQLGDAGQVGPVLASLQPDYAFDAYGLNKELTMAAWNPAPSVPSVSLYPQPPSPTKIVTKKHSRQLTKQKQDKTTPYKRASKRRPTIPDHFIAHIDVDNPPRRESEVHDVKGCKDTTLANDYYYRINSLPPLRNFFGKGSDITYQGPEFHKNVEFTGPEFMRYLRTSARTPVLIIQLQPQKCNHRYIRGGQSFKCRSKNCPDPKKTIWKGHFRVCITEFYDAEGHWVNPFQSAAGYLHLYCLEHMLNLSEVVADVPVSVRPEVRNFKHEPGNPMELGKTEQRTYEKWVDEFVPKWATFREQHTRARTPRDQWPSLAFAEQDRLYHRLTAAHLKKNPGTVKMAQKRRAKAGDKKIAAHVDQVLGDVGMHVAVMKRRRNACAAGMDGDGDGDHDEIDKPPTSKRRRVSSCHQYNLRSATPRRAGQGQDPATQPKATNHNQPRQQKNGKSMHPEPSPPPPPPQAQLRPCTTTLPPGTEQQPLAFATDDPTLFDVKSSAIPLPELDDTQFNALLLEINDATDHPLFPLVEGEKEEVPGDSIVEQSIVVKAFSNVPVPTLTSPPRTTRRRCSLAAHKSPGVNRSPGIHKSPGARRVRV